LSSLWSVVGIARALLLVHLIYLAKFCAHTRDILRILLRRRDSIKFRSGVTIIRATGVDKLAFGVTALLRFSTAANT
jgi:hypothetical protein